jgi:hypothetical protein
MSLATLLDIIWAEMWDDCSPMGDVHQYREIITQLYIEGKDPSTISYRGADGKVKKLTLTSSAGGEPPQSARDEAKAMMARARELAEAKALASQPSGNG